jgi:hypothetical protein
MTVEIAAARALDERIRGEVLQAALLAVGSFSRNRSTGEIKNKIELGQGWFPAPHHIVESVRADLLELIVQTRQRREGLLKRRTR